MVKKSPITKKRVIRRRRARRPNTFVKRVQAIISKQTESKQAFTTLAPTYYNSGISAVADMTQIVPNISQSLADNGRVGDQLRAQSLICKGALQISGASSSYSNSRIACRLFIVQPKNLGSLSAVTGTTSWLSTLLKKGGTTTAFTGVMSDLWAPVNTDAVTKYYDKIFYLDTAYVSVAGTSTTGNSVKFFTKKLMLRNKLVKYDNSIDSGLTPVNYNPVMLLGYVHMDGSSPDTLTTAVSLQYDSIFNYEDA